MKKIIIIQDPARSFEPYCPDPLQQVALEHFRQRHHSWTFSITKWTFAFIEGFLKALDINVEGETFEQWECYKLGYQVGT